MKEFPFSKYIVATLILFLMVLGYFHPINAFTQDLGRHILTGNIILKTLQVPKVNLFAYTYPDFPVINTHWLAEVVFAGVDNSVHVPGLFGLMLLLLIVAWLVQLKAVWKRSSVLALGVSGILYIRILLERTDLRPELFSFLFLSIVVALLYRQREKSTKLILLLIPIQLLWVNMHIYFAIGLVVQGLFLLDLLYLHRKHLLSTQVKLSAITFVGSLIASLLNPHGLAGMLYPLHVFNNYGYTIEENQTVFLLESLGFRKPSLPFLKLSVLILFVSMSISWRKTRPIDWLLAVVFTILAFSAVRNLPLFVFATFIPFTVYLTTTFATVSRMPQLQTTLKKYSLYVTLGSLIILFCWQGMAISSLNPLGYGVTPGATRAVDFLQREHISGPIFNNFDIGGYLLSRIYPVERVFVDGRPEAYPADFFSKIYIPMQQNQEVFDKVVNEKQIDTIFFPHTDQTPWGTTFLQWILKHPDWRIIYVDDFVVILLKQTPENAPLIKKYGMPYEHMRITRSENTFEANLRIAAFLSKVNLPKQSIPYLEEIIRLKPEYCPAIGVLAQTMEAAQDPAAMIYIQMYNQTCH